MNREKLLKISTYALLIIWAFFVLFPLYWMVTTSFKPKLDVFLGPKYIPWVDFKPVLQWWRRMFIVEREEVLHPLINSVVIATTSSLFAMLFGTMAAYALTRYRFKFGPLGNKDIIIWIISQRMMPPIVIALALFLMFRVSHLLDTRVGMILIYTAFNLPIAVWVMRNFLSQIPSSIEEAAKIDGASGVQMLFKIVIPLTLPSLAATFLLCFIFAWNEFLFALILTYDTARTMPILISSMHFQRGPQWWDISVLSTIAIAPVVIIALSLQRYLVKGLIPISK
ncbi:carbohydrate ABC transporter permease [Candidatus Aerophobetes bacterium]|uniref:Carbohydrate ABC transporter permease n=1 Tax=Aerophobetes bacterium TaxID=2030807 RepID=A0A662D3J2_UNCAE|nr:MAG: carbohydrate ABC transporter permease [Candidatus Aerophobetes bacterium]